MSAPPPIPLTPAEQARAKIARTVRFARLSAGTMLVLGALSAVICVRQPLSAGFLISIGVLVSGVLEWRFATRLAAHDTHAPRKMAINQLVLGVEIAAYAAWQAVHVTSELIDSVLARPFVSAVLEAFEPEQISALHDLLPPLIRTCYVVVGVGAFAGCVGTAMYFRARGKLLSRLNS